MRAKEFIFERQYMDPQSDALIYSKHYPSMPSNNPYLSYRFSMAMANHEIKDVEAPASQHAVVVTYTKEDDDIVKVAEKKTGHKGKVLSSAGSTEPDGTNKQSIVPVKKTNRYGV